MNSLGASGKLLPLWPRKQISFAMILAEREQRSPECLKQLETGDSEPAPYPLSLTNRDAKQITLMIGTSGPPSAWMRSSRFIVYHSSVLT